MSETIVLAFLALSLVAYVVCGGADFGVGILELFTPKAKRSSMREAGEHAIAPVWEANHVWLIVALVILFVGFPAIHVRLTTYLHIPLLLMLAGIMLRGTAFTFRYYEVDDDPPTDRLWSILFRTGSVLVPLMFGHLAASFSRGLLPMGETDVFESYIRPWVGWFPLAVGIFTVNLFAWLAAVFLVGETEPDERSEAVLRAKVCSALLIVTSLVVAGAAQLERVPWFVRSLDHPLSYVCGAVGLACCGMIWWVLSTPAVWLPRVLAGGVVVCVLGGYWGLSYPVALVLSDRTLTWHSAAAPPATLNALAISLGAGAVLIVPGLVWLYRLFKSATIGRARS